MTSHRKVKLMVTQSIIAPTTEQLVNIFFNILRPGKKG